jgi:hypothetical protein
MYETNSALMNSELSAGLVANFEFDLEKIVAGLMTNS